jgi:hypothetical protein
MKEKPLVKVVGTIMTGTGNGRLITRMARGISPLKRGQTMFDFISGFLSERDITTFTLHQRAEKTWSTSPIMSLNEEPQTVVTYHFVEFPQTEIGYHAKDLTTEELHRDMKYLRKIVYG